jgi:hypothetical protein
MTIVVLGSSDLSQFDFGISVSPFSTNTWKIINNTANFSILALLIFTFFYVIIKKFIKALKYRAHD